MRVCVSVCRVPENHYLEHLPVQSCAPVLVFWCPPVVMSVAFGLVSLNLRPRTPNPRHVVPCGFGAFVRRTKSVFPLLVCIRGFCVHCSALVNFAQCSSTVLSIAFAVVSPCPGRLSRGCAWALFVCRLLPGSRVCDLVCVLQAQTISFCARWNLVGLSLSSSLWPSQGEITCRRSPQESSLHANKPDPFEVSS